MSSVSVPELLSRRSFCASFPLPEPRAVFVFVTEAPRSGWSLMEAAQRMAGDKNQSA